MALQKPGTDLTPELIGLLHQKSQIEMEKHDRQTKNQLALKQLDFQKQESKAEHEKWQADREAQMQMAAGQNKTQLAQEQMQQAGWDKQRQFLGEQQVKEQEFTEKVSARERQLYEEDRTHAEQLVKTDRAERGDKIQKLMEARSKTAHDLAQLQRVRSKKLEHVMAQSTDHFNKVTDAVKDATDHALQQFHVEGDAQVAGSEAAKTAALSVAGVEPGSDDWNAFMEISKPKTFWDKMGQTLLYSQKDAARMKTSERTPSEILATAATGGMAEGLHQSSRVFGTQEDHYGVAKTDGNDAVDHMIEKFADAYGQISGKQTNGLKAALYRLSSLYDNYMADGTVSEEESQQLSEEMQKNLEASGTSPTEFRGLLRGIGSIGRGKVWQQGKDDLLQEASDVELEAATGDKPKEAQSAKEFRKAQQRMFDKFSKMQVVADAAFPGMNPRHEENIKANMDVLNKATEKMSDVQKATFYRDHPAILDELGLKHLMEDPADVTKERDEIGDMDVTESDLLNQLATGGKSIATIGDL